jgi:hypothetical protein
VKVFADAVLWCNFILTSGGTTGSASTQVQAAVYSVHRFQLSSVTRVLVKSKKIS